MPQTHITVPYLAMDMLRFTTAGSVDDGKSTLIGRLLLRHQESSSRINWKPLNGPAASAERRTSTWRCSPMACGPSASSASPSTWPTATSPRPRRKFIIADTPGHIQYTRNMVTGASTAELAIILIDAQRGVLTQSKRHGFIASLLRIPHILVAVNKMDLVGYSEEVFDRIAAEYAAFAAKLSVPDLTFIPISALKGDNVVHRSENMPWYDGVSLLHHLEHVSVGSSRNLVDFRFPVQMAIRPNQRLPGLHRPDRLRHDQAGRGGGGAARRPDHPRAQHRDLRR